MRPSLRLAVLFSLALCGPAAAQPSPYGSLEGNLGTWKWDKSPSPKSNESDEREPGETSWERLNAERNAEAADAPKEEAPKALSPLQMWRLLRGKHDE
ncbi:MAG: hypothetical protein HYZ72_03620 [Deltaproteobacteria bacterium]|nr:hypothetical protein [Deltaproteobacteria bacterium]